jgi:competence protein ComEC
MYRVALICLFGFSILQAFTKFNMFQQKKLIIYNVPQHNAMDFISGNKYFFLGDSILQQDGVLQNFHLKPTRISMQLDNKADHINGLFHINNYWQYFNKKIIMIDSPVYYEPLVNKLYVDIVIISKNPTLEISGITAAIRPSIILFDSSNSLWKIGKWKKECLSLALTCFSIPEQGAFVLNID